jgi:hypothetical protein
MPRKLLRENENSHGLQPKSPVNGQFWTGGCPESATLHSMSNILLFRTDPVSQNSREIVTIPNMLVLTPQSSRLACLHHTGNTTHHRGKRRRGETPLNCKAKQSITRAKDKNPETSTRPLGSRQDGSTYTTPYTSILEEIRGTSSTRARGHTCDTSKPLLTS